MDKERAIGILCNNLEYLIDIVRQTLATELLIRKQLWQIWSETEERAIVFHVITQNISST
jgi:hypothetical protein